MCDLFSRSFSSNDWSEKQRDLVFSNISGSTGTYKDPTDKVYQEAQARVRLAQLKEEFEEENHKNRLQTIKKRLAEEQRDSWRRPSADVILCLKYKYSK